MKENKWRSLSIMDLAKKGSFSGSSGMAATGAPNPHAVGGKPANPQDQTSASNGQSYELIKSTQSLVDRLQLNAEDITIHPVHPSIIGQDTWFQITYTSSGSARYFSCQSPKERDEWIASLKKALMTSDRRRTDNSLKLDILEAKGLTLNKKYYVEILVDDKLYARTSIKKINADSTCMWCESFHFSDLAANTSRLTLVILKDKKAKKPVGRVKLSMASVTSRYTQDQWYPLEKKGKGSTPSIRMRAQFQSVEILPLREYEEFMYLLKDEYKDLCKALEPCISVKVKEELAHGLMHIFHAEDMAEDVLADLVVDEISQLENEHLTFRGNSIATKAMECYIKLVGGGYLTSTLQTVVSDLITSDLDLEVDPVKVSSIELLACHRANLTSVVKSVWGRVVKSHAYFPAQLQRCFYKIRQYLAHVGKPDLGDNLISSCIFLRYICPAILSPSLFGLADQYPGERANRNLTLVAKTLQTLANFTRYESKENSMEFLNPFLAEETGPMKAFLRQISSPVEDAWIPDLLALNPEKADLGRHLSTLHTILLEHVSKLGPNARPNRLRHILDEINQILDRPTIPQLEQISQPTMDTLKMKQPKANTFFAIPWLGTLPKRKQSHPAPHHEAQRKASTTNLGPPIEDSASSASPGGFSSTDSSSGSSVILGAVGGPRPDSKVGLTRLHMFTHSNMSLSDSSDDSTYSSQYQSDSTTPRQCGASNTLPRLHHNISPPRKTSSSSSTVVKVKSLSDYESEILQMRAEMEQLQAKLSEAERQLQFPASNSSSSCNGDPPSSSSETSLDPDKMIVMQQKKIAALDAANKRLLEELNRMTAKVSVTTNGVTCLATPSGAGNEVITTTNTTTSPRRVSSSSSSSNKSITVITADGEAVTKLTNQASSSNNEPKTVDELLDSLHSTSI